MSHFISPEEGMRTILPRLRARPAIFVYGLLMVLANGCLAAQTVTPVPGKPRVLLAQLELTPAAQLGGEVLARMLDFGFTTRGFQTRNASGDAECVVAGEPQTGGGDIPTARVAPGEFYVTGRMDADSTTFQLSYRIRRCEAQGMSEVSADEQRVPVKESLALFQSIVESIADRVEDALTRTSVTVAPIVVESGSAAYAEDLRAGLRQALHSSSALMPSENGGRYLVNGRLTVVHAGGAQMVNGTLTLFRALESVPFDSIRFNSRIDSVPSALLGATQSIASRIELDRLSGSNPVIPTNDAGALVVEAEQLLRECGESFCPAAKLAYAGALLTRATEIEPGNWKIRRILGWTEFQQRNYESAARHLTRAFELWVRGTSREEEKGAEIQNDLAQVFRATGNVNDALEANRRSLALVPGQTSVLEMEVENLRLLHRSSEALSIIADLAARAPERSTIEAEFALLLRAAPDSVLSRKLEIILPLCRRSVRVAEQCADAIVPVSSIGLSSGVAARGGAVARNLLSVPELPADTRGALYGIVASAAMGTVFYGSHGDESFVRTRPVDYPALRATLAQAALLPQDSLSARTREWLTRISALEHLGAGELGLGYAESERAREILASPGSEFVHAVGSYLVARIIDQGGEVPGVDVPIEGTQSLYRAAAEALLPLVRSRYHPAYHFFRAANHALHQDMSSRAEFLALTGDSVDDLTARWSLAMVCVDYVHDYACGYRQYRELGRLGRLQTPGDSLSAVEAAVLADQLPDGLHWLGSTAARQATDCYRSVAYFYAVWLASSNASHDRVAAAHRQWKAALQSHRASGAAKCWRFDAAEVRLRSEPPPVATSLLTSMIAAMSDDAAPIPELP